MFKLIKKLINLVLIIVVLGVAVTAVVLGVMKNKNEDYTGEPTRFIAHRGLSGEYYQNTLEAFKAAAESDFFYGIETDIYQTKDGVWVCCHDENPFEDSSILISNVTFSEAQALPLAKKNAGTAPYTGDERICSFDDYITAVTDGGKVPIIEIKQKISVATAAEVYAMLKLKGIEYKCQIISFEYKTINGLRVIDNKLKLQQLTSGVGFRTFLELAAGHNAGISYKKVTKTLVDTAHRNGCTINVWTVNDITAADEMVKLGVDYITTDNVLY